MTDKGKTEPVAGTSSAGTVKVITVDQERTDKATDTSQAKVKPGHQYEASANYPLPDMPDSPPRTAGRSHPSTEPVRAYGSEASRLNLDAGKSNDVRYVPSLLCRGLQLHHCR